MIRGVAGGARGAAGGQGVWRGVLAPWDARVGVLLGLAATA